MYEALRALTRAVEVEGRRWYQRSKLFTCHVTNFQLFIGRSNGSRFRGDMADSFVKNWSRLSL
jgi:hypothetical protein